jgi:hypothetical protein
MKLGKQAMGQQRSDLDPLTKKNCRGTVEHCPGGSEPCILQAGSKNEGGGV